MSKLNQLLCFLNTASKTWDGTNNILKFPLDNGKSVSCIYWKGDYFITGTDIIRCLVYRFQAAGYYVIHQKKFEEGVFSDLRNLKPGLDAVLEPAHSELLRFLHRHQCIRTQKKQKIFFWNAVPHDRLFSEALERDVKREAVGLPLALSGPNSQSKLGKVEYTNWYKSPIPSHSSGSELHSTPNVGYVNMNAFYPHGESNPTSSYDNDKLLSQNQLPYFNNSNVIDLWGNSVSQDPPSLVPSNEHTLDTHNSSSFSSNKNYSPENSNSNWFDNPVNHSPQPQQGGFNDSKPTNNHFNSYDSQSNMIPPNLYSWNAYTLPLPKKDPLSHNKDDILNSQHTFNKKDSNGHHALPHNVHSEQGSYAHNNLAHPNLGGSIFNTGSFPAPTQSQDDYRTSHANVEETTHKCPHSNCFKEFGKRSQLRRHIQSHTDERSFLTGGEGENSKPYNRKDIMHQHMKNYLDHNQLSQFDVRGNI